MGASQRRKGATWERDLAARWRDRFPGLATKRGIGQMRNAAEVADVDGLPGFWVEAKCGAMPNPRAALAQAQEACGDRPLWCVAVVKDDRRPPFVCLSLEDFEDILTELYGLKGLIGPAANDDVQITCDAERAVGDMNQCDDHIASAARR